MEGNTICPYPGLRPFNEDEAIFFKGREEHIEQIVKQLEEKKFLMLTGASGDGKSSLVYAGVIPNARAGFFKAKFNNWIIADFRPEREPLSNMAFAINEHLKINDAAKVEKEFSYGFSALIDLYKSSPFWVDQQSESFRQLTGEEQKKAKRKGANLLIIVDQFEEFFTNPENYINGKTSIESQAVVNLLLETTRLSIEQDLPIYIICTMRSDYIGQCASFRGLPEYIGYSQFFVPRLKRQEIYQVIEEPAQLNGNKISKRLVEMLINEMNDGIDQLPVLQHALNQIWQKADRGGVEMDLIHFAKINGIPLKQLPPNDQSEFEKWFDTQAEFKKNFFKKPSLGAVLDAHANELYESADAGYASVSKEDAKLIVETAFKCLTKIDASRAVRNRMSLGEVTNIINQPHITTSVVAKVLEVFRIQGNTFLKPFIFDQEQPRELADHSVLDITHESLIRNWNLLSNWAQEEYESYITWQDFNKQLQRWIKSEKSSGYLLPIGPLTFFETWYNNANPNKYLLARYDDREISKEQKIEEAEETLKLTNQFIRRSARRLFFSRTVLKYGADKLIAVFGLLLLIFGCTYFYFDFRKKQNSYVVEDIQDKGLELLKSNKIKNVVKAQFIINYERLNPNTIEKVLKNLENDTTAFDLAFEAFKIVQNYDEHNFKTELPLTQRLTVYMDNVLSANLIKSEENLRFNIKRLNQFVVLCAYIKYHVKSKSSDELLNNVIGHAQKYVQICLSDVKKADTEEFNSSIKLLLALSPGFSVQIPSIVKKLTPYDDNNITRFNVLYPKDQSVKVDWENYLTHKGGYQILSYLYATLGDYVNVNRSLDSIYKYNPKYDKQGSDGISDILSIVMKYQNIPSLAMDGILENYIKKNAVERKLSSFYASKLYGLLQNRSGFRINKVSSKSNLFDPFMSSDKYIPLIELKFSDIEKDFKDNQEKVLNKALFLKKLAIYYKTIENNDVVSSKYFNEAIKIYSSLQEDFLNKNLVFYDDKNKPITPYESIKNSVAFLYPVSISENAYYPLDLDWVCENESGCWQNKLFNGGIFFRYLDENNQTKLYKSKEDFDALTRFTYNLINSTEKYVLGTDSSVYRDFEIISKFILSNKSFTGMTDSNFVGLIHLKKSQVRGIYSDSSQILKNLSITKITDPSFEKIENRKSEIHKQLMSNLVTYLAFIGRSHEAFKVKNSIVETSMQRNALIDAAYNLIEKEKMTGSFQFIDSILPDIKAKPKFGMKLFQVFGMIGSTGSYATAMNIFRDIDDKLKPRALKNFIRGISKAGFYYVARSNIPKTVSSVNELDLYNEILHAEVMKMKNGKKQRSLESIWQTVDNLYYGEFTVQNYEFEREHFDMFAD